MEAIKPGIKPNNFKNNNYFITQINKAYSLTLIVLLSGLLISFVVNIFENDWKYFDTILYTFGSTLFICCFYINHIGKYKLSATIFVLGISALLFILTLNSKDVYLSRILNLVLIPMVFIYISGTKRPIYVALVLLMAHLLSYGLIMGSSPYLSNSFHSNFQLVFIYIIAFICLLGLTIIIKTYVENSIVQNIKLVKKLNRKNREVVSKNAELENFAFLISHDLKSPLQVMNGFTNLLAKDLERNETKNLIKYSSYINDQSKKLTKMIDDVLDYSKLDQSFVADNGYIDLNPVVETVKSKLDLDKKDAIITYDSLGKLKAKESLIKILFQNLIENGLKYNKSEKPAVHITSETIKTKKIIKVIDNGIGIDESNRESVFHLFKRLHNGGEFKGTGIGLATCKKITEKHLNGKITVQENPGGGSVFSISV